MTTYRAKRSYHAKAIDMDSQLTMKERFSSLRPETFADIVKKKERICNEQLDCTTCIIGHRACREMLNIVNKIRHYETLVRHCKVCGAPCRIQKDTYYCPRCGHRLDEQH